MGISMMKIVALLFACASVAVSFHIEKAGCGRLSRAVRSHEESRADFLQNAALVAGAVLLPVEPSFARGRATLEQAYDRYTPRILAGGTFFLKDLRAMVGKSDWAAIKEALAEPPKKSKEDRAKLDGGSTERAALAGGFSEARLLVACDLFAAAFSDNSISAKTKTMKAEVEELRKIVESMAQTARQALGEESGGGLFAGFGAKKPTQAELTLKIRELYAQGGTAYNKYIFAANAELPLQLKKLPYL
jgi:hypothetical protein